LTKPEFPLFKPIELEDRDFIQDTLWKYQPEASELTFTNLFIWRAHYGFQWSVHRDWLLVLCSSSNRNSFFLPPVGPSSRSRVAGLILSWLREEKKEKEPLIERADSRLVSEIEGDRAFVIQPTREHFDYVYRSRDLILLQGSKYHAKRNHINKFRSSYSFAYSPLADNHLQACLDLAGAWCDWRRCEEDLSLIGEWDAVRQALNHFYSLKLQGGVIVIEGKVEAFAVGELLNEQTAVVHVEKANPEIKGLYAVINQQFCEKNWANIPFINREQDLGEEGLRQAKLSYQPDHLVQKFNIGLA
jgi:hypothetical protein